MKSPKILLIGLTLTALIVAGSADKILFLLPLASRSHVHVFEPLIKELGERGHEIVSLQPTVSKGMPPTVKQIQLITVEDLVGKMPNPFEKRKESFIAMMANSSSWEHMNQACLKTLKNPRLYDEILPQKFDLIIVDIFLNYCVLGLIPHFQAPSIYVSTIAAPSSISNVIGNRLPPSFVPNAFLQFSHVMSFKDRFINTIMDFISSILWDHIVVRQAEKMYRDHLPNGHELPDIFDIQANVGGMHTRPPKKLPKDLDDFLTGSGEDGFIFFSLGSIVNPKEMPEETRKTFVRVFSKLKQRVLWKWSDETMPDCPPNVKLAKWLPQQDILGHPNIKLFMTHGGLLSTQESVYHGVPVLGLPVFGDQDLNVKEAEKGGYAKFVEILDMSEEKLEEALMELLNNPKYTQRVKALSKVVKDRPMTPLQTATYWTEYVLKHKGAPHLRSAARDLNFFQYYVLDVTAAFFAIVALALYLVKGCCKAGWRCVRGSKKTHLKKD